MDKDQKERVDQALLLFRGKSTESVNDFVTQLFVQHPTHQARFILDHLLILLKKHTRTLVLLMVETKVREVRASKLINKLDKENEKSLYSERII